MTLNPQQFGSTTTPATKPKATYPADTKWFSVGGYKDAHAQAESFQNSWMNQPQHRDSYQHFVWHNDPKRGGEHSMQTYDHVRPETQKGVAGIVTQRGSFHDFIPNANIIEMAHHEREGATPAWKRDEDHMRSRSAAGYQ
jgi:hypothetical protein